MCVRGNISFSWQGQFLLHATRISGYQKENNSALVVVLVGTFTMLLMAMKGSLQHAAETLH